jgi:hypothetical protein
MLYPFSLVVLHCVHFIPFIHFIPLPSLYLFYNLSKCILLLFSAAVILCCCSSLLLFFSAAVILVAFLALMVQFSQEHDSLYSDWCLQDVRTHIKLDLEGIHSTLSCPNKDGVNLIAKLVKEAQESFKYRFLFILQITVNFDYYF